MKILRKILLILPTIALGLTVLLAFVTFCLGFGEGIWYGTYNHGILSNAYYANFEVNGVTEMCIGNTFAILGMLISIVLLVLTLMNFSDKVAKGPLLLVVSIASFLVQFFFLPRPIMLIYYTTQDVGNVFEGFNWATFSVSTLIFLPTLVLFILNKTLFKKALNDEQPVKQETPKAEEKKEKEAKSGWVCPVCGEHNEGNFCSKCGAKKPE